MLLAVQEEPPETPREAAFFVALGTCVETARSAGLVVSLELVDGSTVAGVPEESASVAAGEPEIDHTGTRSYLELGGELVMLDRVRRYTLSRP